MNFIKWMVYVITPVLVLTVCALSWIMDHFIHKELVFAALAISVAITGYGIIGITLYNTFIHYRRKK